jgi:hypothetical protein
MIERRSCSVARTRVAQLSGEGSVKKPASFFIKALVSRATEGRTTPGMSGGSPRWLDAPQSLREVAHCSISL